MSDEAINLPPDPDLSVCTKYPSLQKFDQYYKTIHAYLSLSVCFLGICTNSLNAIVLTHRHMRSPTNLLLTSIAIADSATMIAYVAKDVYLHFITSPDPESAPHGRAGIYFVLFTNFTAIAAHIFSTIMTVLLAVFRCWVLYRPHKQVLYKHIKISIAVAVICSIGMFVLGVSALVVGKRTPRKIPENSTENYYWFDVREGLDYLEGASFIIYGCFSKLASSILITFFTALILAALEKARRRYLNLKSKSSGFQNEETTRLDGRTTDLQYLTQRKRESRENHRTTVMLVAVVVSFVITEAPQGVIMTIVAFNDYCFSFNFYAPIGDLLDILVLLNSSTNFILYCVMSAQFRKSFRELIMENLVYRICARRNKNDDEEANAEENRGTKHRVETVLDNQI
ncbi:hypothetical protein Aperf_G00000030224 [Anoplocephala perfoliata]